MEIQIGSKYIDADIKKILYDLRDESKDGRLSIIKDNGDDISFTCPFHAEGMEKHPSMGMLQINKIRQNSTIPAGTCNCFTCHYHGNLVNFVADYRDTDIEQAEDWLLSHYGDLWIEKDYHLSDIKLTSDIEQHIMKEEELDKYRYYHPYMYERHLTNPIIEKFDIGYDKEINAITFPVRDIKNNLLFVTKRCVDKKTFLIPSGVEKPVYLLNTILLEGYDTAYICESQLNALTLWTWGYPGVALFGTGDEIQYRILEHSGINHFILCFDGDSAGRQGATKFKKYFANKPFIIDDVQMIWGRDINNISKEMFENILKQSSGYIII